jgi:hypothetical protein
MPSGHRTFLLSCTSTVAICTPCIVNGSRPFTVVGALRWSTRQSPGANWCPVRVRRPPPREPSMRRSDYARAGLSRRASTDGRP